MKIYDVYVPEIDVYVKFKVLDPDDSRNFMSEHSEIDINSFKAKVLDYYIFNLRTEVLKKLGTECLPVVSESVLDALYNACVQLNPALDIDKWLSLAFSSFSEKLIGDGDEDDISVDLLPTGITEIESEDLTKTEDESYDYKKIKPLKISRAKYANLGQSLRSGVVGQEEAVEALEGILRRSQAGLADTFRPLGVLMFAGSSGTGKTLLAKALHSHLFGDNVDMVRIDCGELQHRHENQKLIGSPSGYIGHEAGGLLTNALMKNPNTVVLLDEVEKAHTDIFNTFLRIFDEGLVTDAKGNVVSFRNAIIIMTTNLGNKKIVGDLTSSSVGFGGSIGVKHSIRTPPKRDIVERETKDAVKKHFSPELLNRIDGIVVFNHLSEDNFKSIAELELLKVDNKLARKGIRFSYDDSVINGLVELGVDAIKGARGMSTVRRDNIENILADEILNNKITRGSLLEMSYEDGVFRVNTVKPRKTSKAAQ